MDAETITLLTLVKIARKCDILDYEIYEMYSAFKEFAVNNSVKTFVIRAKSRNQVESKLRHMGYTRQDNVQSIEQSDNDETSETDRESDTDDEFDSNSDSSEEKN